MLFITLSSITLTNQNSTTPHNSPGYYFHKIFFKKIHIFLKIDQKNSMFHFGCRILNFLLKFSYSSMPFCFD